MHPWGFPRHRVYVQAHKKRCCTKRRETHIKGVEIHIETIFRDWDNESERKRDITFSIGRTQRETAERQRHTLRKQRSEECKKEKNSKQRDTIPEYESKRERDFFTEEKTEIHEGLFVTQGTHDCTTPLLSIRIKFLRSVFFFDSCIFLFSIDLSTQSGAKVVALRLVHFF